ncbi:MAG: hypothetical protein IJ092_08280 [Atopobiaceae bacterium]|nr:hypothetical protein [Atopobiaceae bacterium]MBR1829125.1 hypothetical protein [Atopobiaceae bacterium]
MAYNTPDRRQPATTRRHQGRAGDTRSASTGSVSSSGTRRVQARGGSSAQYRNSKNRRSRNNGYSLGTRNNGIGRRRGGLINQALEDPKLLLIMVVGLALVVALLFGLFSLVRGCVAKRTQRQQADTEEDTRVSLSVSSEMASKYTEELDRYDLLSQIAQNAEAVGDERLLQLALDEPSAVEFVAGYLNDTPKKAQAYEDNVSTGYYPKLYDWDTRWGYVTYGEAPMALTGSGPTSLAMAYMGLKGKADQTPDAIATLATKQEGTDKVYGTSSDFFLENAASLGLEIQEFSASGENLTDILESGTVILVQLRERSLTDNAHWALAVGKNLDGSINLYDPTSSAVTEHPWDPDTIAAGSDAFYVLTAMEEETEGTAE